MLIEILFGISHIKVGSKCLFEETQHLLCQ